MCQKQDVPFHWTKEFSNLLENARKYSPLKNNFISETIINYQTVMVAGYEM